MSQRDDFFAYMILAGGSLLGLFALQALFASYLDVSFHDDIAARGSHPVVDKARASERVQLDAIGDSMAKLAKSRSADAKIVPVQSADLGAMSGWVHHPEFKMYEAATPPAPAAVPMVAPVAAPVAAPVVPVPATPTQEHAQ